VTAVASGTPFVHMTHPGIDGETLVPDDASVVEAFEAKGWIRSEGIPEHLDPDAPNTGRMAQAPILTPSVAEAEPPPPAAATPPDPVTTDPAVTETEEPAPTPGPGSSRVPTPAPAAGDDTTGE
jgi:hypothetical protein